MSPDNSTSTPAILRRTTPMQALSGLFRTPTRLRTPSTVSRRNKRGRARTSSLSSTTPSTPSTPSLPAVVLQTYSASTDSIVLTALQSAPFCCHEDLLTMSREQLEAVVCALNARLPRRMRIGPEDDFWQNDDQGRDGDPTGECDDDDRLSRMSETEMRRRVEELVGIRAVVGKNRVTRSGLGLPPRTGVPPAPKAVRTRDASWRPCEKNPWEMEVNAAEDHSDDLSIMIEDALIGSSPLASRARSGPHTHGQSNTFPRLAVLQEENEGGDPKEDESVDNETRPSKRQRVSPGSTTRDSEGMPQVIQKVVESRLIENMDLSASPFLVRDDEVPSENFIERCETVATTTECTQQIPSEGVQGPLWRRRSARIKEIALKRMSSVDTDTSKASDLKSSISRSRTLSSRRLSRNSSRLLGQMEGSDTPKEFTIRLPFTSTPPHKDSNLPAWSAPRILRSHSQRLLNPSKSTKKKASLGRSQSEKYPRTPDLTFVTIDRPRYRFERRRSKGTKVTNGDQASHLSLSASPEHGERQHEKENEYLNVSTQNSATSNGHIRPSALCSLAQRSTAPSTSTVASARGSCDDSPTRMMAQAEAPTTMVTDGATEPVWEALERMAVDSV